MYVRCTFDIRFFCFSWIFASQIFIFLTKKQHKNLSRHFYPVAKGRRELKIKTNGVTFHGEFDFWRSIFSKSSKAGISKNPKIQKSRNPKIQISAKKKVAFWKNMKVLEFSADHFGYGTVKIREILCFSKIPEIQKSRFQPKKK